MGKLRFLLLSVLYFNLTSAQTPVAILPAPRGFNENGTVAGCFNPISRSFTISFQSHRNITRTLYDSAFQLQSQYSMPTNKLSYSSKGANKVHFFSSFITGTSTLDVFVGNKEVLIYKPDFTSKNDSLVYHFRIGNANKDEKLLAILPEESVLFILTYSKKLSKLFCYRWEAEKKTRKSEFLLPETNHEDQLFTGYQPYSKFNVPRQLSSVVINHTNRPSPISSASNCMIYYDSTRIILLMDIPLKMGVFLIELNAEAGTINTHNFFINPYENYDPFEAVRMKYPVAAIFGDVLIVNNASAETLEYIFYDLKTRAEIKRYTTTIDSLSTLIHSPLKQKGTFASRREGKELDNKRLFLERRNRGELFLTVSKAGRDHFVLTTGSFIPTPGLESAFVSMAVLPFGYMPAVQAGLPYSGWSVLGRSKIIYAHSKFSTQLQPAQTTSVSTVLDTIMEKFQSGKDPMSKQFVINHDELYYLGSYNRQTNSFEIFRLGGN